MAKREKAYNIDQLADDNYLNWKFRMEMILDENAVKECVTKEIDITTLNEDEQGRMKKNNSKDKSLIVQCVSDKHLEILRDKESAFAMWKALEDRFERKGLPGQLHLKKKLLSMKLGEDESLQEFMNQFEEVIRQLKATGVEIDTQDIICNLLLALPKPFETVVTVIENMSSEDLTYEIVKKKLLADEEKRSLNKKTHRQTTNQAAFNVNMTCFRCGKAGHFKRDCRVRIGGSDGGNFSNAGSGRGSAYINTCNYRTNTQANPNRGDTFTRGSYRGHQRGRGNYQRKTPNEYQRHGRSNYSENEETPDQVSGECGAVSFMTDSSATNNSDFDRNITFCVDSGCTDHMVNDKTVFTELVMLDKPVKIAVAKNENYLLAIGVGNIHVYSFIRGMRRECTIMNVFYVPNLRKNLLSVKKLEVAGVKVIFEHGLVKLIQDKHGLIGLGRRNNLYEISFEVINNYCQNVTVENNDFKLWHKRFAHLNYNALGKLIKQKMVNGIDDKVKICQVDFCEPCVEGKITRLPYGTRTKSQRLLQVVHTDICGPISPITHDGHKYFITFIDDYSNFTVVYLLKSKDEAFDKFQEYFQMTKSMFTQSISKLRCDNGGEYVSNRLKNFCRDNGIIIDYTVPYNPQQNGKAERKNRSLVERARTIISESGLPKKFWGEAILCTNYIINRGPSDGLEDITPAELWLAKKPNVSNFRIFGSTVYCYVESQARDKFDAKAEKCIMLGYAPTGYRLWNIALNKLIVARNVKFNEYNFEYKNAINVKINDNVDEDNNFEVDDHEITQENIDIEGSKNDESESRENYKRQTKIPSRYKDYELYMAFNAMNVLYELPGNYEELESRSDRELWNGAINREIDAIEKNNTWTIINKPRNEKILDTKWVFSIKSLEQSDNDKYKARLVVRGFAQDRNVDYEQIYSPVARMTTIRTLLSIGAQFKFHFRQLDVKTAFLNGTLKGDVYIYPPKGYEIETGKVLKLNKSLYGLRESSRCWNEEINKFLIQLKFTRSENDFCLYTLGEDNDNDRVYLLIYVDNIVIAGTDIQKINSIITQLMSRFEMKDKGILKHFLGLEINYNRNEGILKITQSKYTQKILERFGMENCNGSNIPIDPKLKISGESHLTSKKPVRQLIGCLMYLMVGSRPDICFAISYFSSYQDRCTDEIWSYLKRVLRYLQSTISLGLEYVRQNEPSLVCFVDADWASNVNDRKSVSGFLFKNFGNVICWSSRKQNCISLSSTEAELTALCSAVREGLWLSKLLNDFNISIDIVTYFEDNQACIDLIRNPCNNKRVKHIDIKFKFVCEQLEKKYIDLKYVNSSAQQADILTKGLQSVSFTNFRNKIGLRDFSEEGC
uniref:Retrovirus-related Pol polyprotein from transposon TNT 1-94 n=1 Tax=Photinus pyralis TaxID=7054 RepID=A0A1Y1L115_PHOPY